MRGHVAHWLALGFGSGLSPVAPGTVGTLWGWLSFLAINPWLGLATLLSFAIIVAFSRYVSLASIVAAVFAPFYQALIWGVEPALLAIAAMCLLLVWRHEANIKRLFAGTESKFGQKAAAGGKSLPDPAQSPKAHGHTHSHTPGKHKKGHH